MLDTLQRSACVGELSAFNIEKYLKKVDVSGSSDASVAHTTFDLTGWADNLSSSQMNPQAAYLKEQGSSAQWVESETQHKPASTKMEKVTRGDTTLNTSSPAAYLSNTSSDSNNRDSKRSSIPHSRTSSSSARRSVGSGQSSTLKPPADKMVTCDNTTSSATKTCVSSGRTPTENGVKPGELNPQVSLETSQKCDKSPVASPDMPRTSPEWRKGQSGLPCLKGSSPPTQRVRSAGQQQYDRHGNSPEKKPPPRTAASLSRRSVEKHVGFSCQNSQPPVDYASGK